MSGPPAQALRRLVSWYLRRLGLGGAGLNLLLCGDARSRLLNQRFRGKNAPTDILSFPALDSAPSRGYRGYLGDLALNLPWIRRHRGRFGRSAEEDMALLILHGILHLCGRHHDTPAQEAALWRLQRRHFPPPARLLAGLRSR